MYRGKAAAKRTEDPLRKILQLFELPPRLPLLTHLPNNIKNMYSGTGTAPSNQTSASPLGLQSSADSAPTPSTVKTRLLIISDTHTSNNTTTNPFKDKTLPKADVILHCGDLTVTGKLEENALAIEMLRGLDAELKLVIAGNHDLTLHEEWYLQKGRRFRGKGGWSEELPKQVMAMWKGEPARKAGITYLEEGLHEFRLSNGAHFSVYASPWQPWFGDWAFNYPLNHDRWNPPHLVKTGAQSAVQHPIPDFGGVDIVMTHGPPFMHLDVCVTGKRAGCPHLLAALERARPRLHCFGHIHEARGAERVSWRLPGGLQLDGPTAMQDAVFIDVSDESAKPLQWGKETLLVNASIMDLRYKPRQLPWVVDLELPKLEKTS